MYSYMCMYVYMEYVLAEKTNRPLIDVIVGGIQAYILCLYFCESVLAVESR